MDKTQTRFEYLVTLAVYAHDFSYKYEKLGLQGKECIFIRYLEHSKGYVFIGEKKDGIVIEIESRDAIFSENEFPSKGEINRSIPFREVPEEGEIEGFRLLDPSGSLGDPVEGPMQRQESIPGIPLRRSNRESVPNRHFLVEGAAFIVTPQDDEEPNSIQEALSSSAKDEWRKAMEEEINSMRTNQVLGIG